MVLRRITVENSVRNVPKIEQTKEIKQNMTKNENQSDKIQPISGGGKPNTRKQNKNISQNSKRILKNVAASGFGILQMNNELLLLIKKHTDILIQQTKTKPQDTLEFKMDKQMKTYSFRPPINLLEESKWFLAVSLLE